MTQGTGTSDRTRALAEEARAATARSRLYGLLASVFRREPDDALLGEIANGRLGRQLAAAGFDLGDAIARQSPERLREALAEEFTRLFLGPGPHIAPYESVQLRRGSGILWGEETVAVKRFMEAAGFAFAEGFSDMPDHVSVELEFLSALARLEADAWGRGDRPAAANALRWQQDFIARHAGKWMPAFCRKVRQDVRLPFYRVFADVLRGFLAGEKADIAARLHMASIAGEPASNADARSVPPPDGPPDRGQRGNASSS